jgi:hypothetical protein
MDQCTENACARTWHKSTFKYYSTTESIRQVGLQLLKKGIEFYEKYGSMITSCDFFHPISLSHILPNPKDTHKEVFGSHLDVMIYASDNPSKVFPKPLQM